MAFLTSYSGAKCGSAEDKYYFRFRFLEYCHTKILSDCTIVRLIVCQTELQALKSFFSSPWRAPGSSPVFDACGIAGWKKKLENTDLRLN